MDGMDISVPQNLGMGLQGNTLWLLTGDDLFTFKLKCTKPLKSRDLWECDKGQGKLHWPINEGAPITECGGGAVMRQNIFFRAMAGLTLRGVVGVAPR